MITAVVLAVVAATADALLTAGFAILLAVVAHNGVGLVLGYAPDRLADHGGAPLICGRWRGLRRCPNGRLRTPR